ncbi:hypothetical protein SpCBS45565_g03799 [Spizellomyces sp. 'palustris']|nr:hypothetical protein SpCBS45565_g03799 [Spizellomyces sp. 'palustris']
MARESLVLGSTLECCTGALTVLYKGGNQRELARAKAAKKSGDSGKGMRKDEMTHAQRKEHDKKMLQEKQAAKAAKMAAEAAGKK